MLAGGFPGVLLQPALQSCVRGKPRLVEDMPLRSRQGLQGHLAFQSQVASCIFAAAIVEPCGQLHLKPFLGLPPWVEAIVPLQPSLAGSILWKRFLAQGISD